jgi:hypothetical protein
MSPRVGTGERLEAVRRIGWRAGWHGPLAAAALVAVCCGNSTPGRAGPAGGADTAATSAEAGSSSAATAEPLLPPPSCGGPVPRLDVLPPGYGWHCYADADEPRFSFCMRAEADCEASRASTIATLAERRETHRIGACTRQPGAYCHTFVDRESALPLYFCFPTRRACADSTRNLAAQPDAYGEVSCCEAFVTL